MHRRLFALPLLVLTAIGASSTIGCASPNDGGDEPAADTEDELRAKTNEEWFYTGALPQLDNPVVTISLKGHTVHVRGTVPTGTTIPTLPRPRDYVRTKTLASGRIQVDVVYPTATGENGASNEARGQHQVYREIPFRPDGMTVSNEDPTPHDVPWGGFPFIGYTGTFAMHGPITQIDNKGTPDYEVFYLRRGMVSHGCNRMNGEHVTELAHLIGISMRRIYDSNRTYTDLTHAPVNVIADYDTYGGKLIDVDYATDVGMVRPTGNVEMFGSWAASETPDGRDLPPDMKFERGEAGNLYVFSDHVIKNAVCSIPHSLLPALKQLAGHDGEVPKELCSKKQCIVSALTTGGAALARSKCQVK
jgi:hypothetical protein